MPSSRLAVATHILALHACKPDDVLTSDYVAGSVNTNPVVVRRLLGKLRRAGFVEIKPGVGGGSRLAVAPTRVTLAQVYRAVEDGALLPMHAHTPNPRCPVGAHIQRALADVFGNAEAQFVKALEKQTLAEVVAKLGSTACKG